MPQIDFANYPFISQLFWLTVSFAILYFYAARIILPRISKVLEMRAAALQNALSEAEAIKNQASDFVGEYEAIIADARQESNKIIKEAEAKIIKKQQAQQEKIDQEINSKIAKAESKIADFKKASSKEISALSKKIYQDLIKNYSS